MDEADGHVIMNEPQWQRLWEKSAIGTRITGGGLSFFDEEVMFVHIHRHQPLPYENWIIDKVANNIDLEDKYVGEIKINKTVPGKKIKSVEIIAKIETDN